MQKRNLAESQICFYISLIFFLVLLSCCYLYLIFRNTPVGVDNSVEVIDLDPDKMSFDEFLKRYGKNCSKAEYKRKFKNYKNSLKRIKVLSEDSSYTAHYGINKFSDMTQQEFEDTMLMRGIFPSICDNTDVNRCMHQSLEKVEKPYSAKVPSKFDWRDEGVVGKVQDQGMCCSCWAFSIVGIMESMLRINNRNSEQLRLSVQELTDCSLYTHRCKGGDPAAALKYLCNRHSPITLERRYPLKLVNQSCQFTPKNGVEVINYRVKCDISAKEIVQVIYNHGPVVAAVASATWKNYNGGVIKYNCDTTLESTDHAVQIVGYNMDAEIPYFIARNSWGRDFGDQGYVLIAMEDFTCAVGRQISYFNVSLSGKL